MSVAFVEQVPVQIAEQHAVEERDRPRRPHGGDHFDVAIGLPVRVSDIDSGDLAGVSVDLLCTLGVTDCVQRISVWDPVLVCAAPPLNSYA